MIWQWTFSLLPRFYSGFPPQVPTLSDEWKHAAMQKILVLEKPLPEGAATLYDFENDRWKK